MYQGVSLSAVHRRHHPTVYNSSPSTLRNHLPFTDLQPPSTVRNSSSSTANDLTHSTAHNFSTSTTNGQSDIFHLKRIGE
jgi:hypothetical protein